MDAGPRPYRKYAVALARALAVAALLAAAFAYGYAVWRVASYAWIRGLRFYESYVINADAVRDVIHCFVLGVSAFLLPRFAGVAVPRLKGAGWPLYGFVGLAAATAVAVTVNQVRPFYSSPFAGSGPLFFTLGPLAWQLLWPGFVYGFASAVVGPRPPAAAGRALAAVLALAGAAWYASLLRGLNAVEAATFVGLSLAVSFLSLALRRRTGSIWPAFAGHALVFFFLTW